MHKQIQMNFNVLLTVHLDTIKVLFANLMHKSSLNLCAERSPKESDDIRNHMMHIQGVTGGTDQTSGGCSLC